MSIVWSTTSTTAASQCVRSMQIMTLYWVPADTAGDREMELIASVASQSPIPAPLQPRTAAASSHSKG